ncbi:MAG: hypothetical protein AAFQ43_03325 [Bacteroidota bacterium]
MPRLLLLLAVLLVGLPACSSDVDTTDPEVVAAEAEAAAAEAEAAAAEAEAAASDTPEASGDRATPSPDTPGASDTPAAASGEIDIAGAGDASDPKRGAEVCEALEPALLAMRIDPADLDRYATTAVLAELRSNPNFRNRETGENTPEDVSSWVDDGHPGTCSLSAGGDAWYRLTLQPLTGGRGEYATALTITTSYAEGGP